MKKLFDLYIAWALKDRRWPLLFPFLLFVLFFLTWYYFELSFRETTGHWFFWSISGITLVVAGILYWRISPFVVSRRWLGWFLTLLGVILLI
ncbi:MAG: hypothetical protein OEV55_06160, partial [candidate division Zixibacteria bacterium]|nr:hypothetical protein [candidate division Zixibacteria bacterium]